MYSENNTTNSDAVTQGKVCYTFPNIANFEIAAYRQSLGMSQSQFAKTHKISVSTLQKWERHINEPSLKNIEVKQILSEWVSQQFVKLNPAY